MKANKKYILLFLLPSVVTLLFIAVYPFIFSIYTSLHKASIVTIGRYVGLTNYVSAFQDVRFLNSLKVTFIFVLGATGLELLLGLLLALSLNSEIKGARTFRLILVFPMMITPIVVGIMWRILYDPDFGILNYLFGLAGLPHMPWLSSPSMALFSLIIVDVWEWTPFMMLILLAGLRSLPIEPYEAASIDGASAWQKMIYLTLPLLKSQIIVAILIRTIDAFRAFDIFFVTTRGGPGKATEITSLYVFRVGFSFFRTGYAAALSVILLFIVLIVAIMYIRAMQIGLMRSR